MADTSVDTDVNVNLDLSGGCFGPYWANTLDGVIVFRDPDADPTTSRTTDGGATWGAQVDLEASTVKQMAAFFDKEVPGDDGNLVHIVWLDDANNNFQYRTIDADTGTLGTLRTIEGTVVGIVAGADSHRLGICKTVGGNLLAFYETPSEINTYRSVDAGINWTSRADVNETAGQVDWCLLYPAATADDNDACALFWDVSANEISVKMYDDSADTWTETSILSSMVADVQNIAMDAAIRQSDGMLFGGAHSDEDTTGDDLLTFTVSPNSIASPTIDTGTAAVFTNQAESSQVAMFINQQNNDVYVAYLKGGTWNATVDCVYHKSTDAMTSWGTEQAYSEASADDLRFVHGGRSVGAKGGFYQPSFYNDDLGEIFVNLVNDIPIAAAPVYEEVAFRFRNDDGGLGAPV